MKKNILILLALCLAFAGCTTKRLYFEPGDENITKKISYSGSLPDDIIFANKQVATLDNGNVISKSGLNKNLKLNKGEILLNEAENKFIVSDVTGAIKVLNENGGIILDQNLSAQAIAANINGNNLAVLSADNHAYIIKINSGAVVLDRAFSQNFALDVRAAAPAFLDYLVVFGTLDGKIAIADLNINRIIDSFDGGEQLQVRNMLSVSLTSIISQSLLPRIGKGRIAIHEILINNNAIANLIRENKVHQIYSQMQLNQQNTGMITQTQAMVKALRSNLITKENALRYSTNLQELIGIIGE